MAHSPFTPGIAEGRLPPEVLAENFTDLHPPFSVHEAHVAADRCYFCHDAPCVTACPTSIDIPLFIRQIATGTPEAAARTIFDQNILGGMCARVCPTETLCEEACVRELAEGKPVEIGRLQRHATDTAMARNSHPYERAEATGHRVAVVGAGPAGLACAHRLAMKGHEVTIYEARDKPGGLNEYGIASYKTVNDFAQAEVAWLLQIGGIRIEHGRRLGEDLSLEDLARGHDAVFLGIGLAGVRRLTLEGETVEGVEPAVDFIARLRQCGDLSTMKVGRDVVVIGGGMTAIDAAVQARLLGAPNVTLVYRRGAEGMNASLYEQTLAKTNGVRIVLNAMPVAIRSEAGRLTGVDFVHTEETATGLAETEEGFFVPADQLLTAIGQQMTFDGGTALHLDGAKLGVGDGMRSSWKGVWAGGDCTFPGEDLTVTAVAQGRDAAEDIHARLTGAAD
jgi:glutamate synthase (NADPH/NADH) small chain